MNYIIAKKFYSNEDHLFHIIKEDQKTYHRNEEVYDNFQDFYDAINKNLENANLLKYDFKGVDLSKYDLAKAKISSSIMKKIGIYNDKLYKTIIKDNYLADIMPATSVNLLPCRKEFDNEYIDNEIVLCYISDLHLNHKIRKNFPNTINDYELNEYFVEIIKELKQSLPTFTYNDFVVFVGDISYNFDIFKKFFQVYREVMPFKKTFVVLGNHELWDSNLNNECKSIEEIVEKYRKFLSSFENEIILLENQLYLPNDEKHIYSADEIMIMDDKILRNKFINNGYALIGGLGYAGLNEVFNCNHGIYQSRYITREQEINRSNEIARIHAKLNEIASDKKIFFITHMPKDDWTVDNYSENWIYISGHTHKNYYIESDKKTVYADNQVGYLNSSFQFKYAVCSKSYNIFVDYIDGIYEITRDQYKLFYYGMGVRINFNREFKALYMVKKDGYYCFLMESKNGKGLKFLNGGNIANIGKHDLNYFYENLANYANSIKLYMNTFQNYLVKISNEIKKIGGTGKIHGCIIDIDYDNHLYVNVLDSKITPYFAYSMTDKWVYQNLCSLLKFRNKELYNNFIKMLKLDNNSVILYNNDLTECKKGEFVVETDIYRNSKIIKSFQYIINNNIVRIWSDLTESSKSIENGGKIVYGLISSLKFNK